MLIQKDQVEGNLDHPLRFIQIPATSNFDLTANLFEMDDLAFMLDDKVSRFIVYDLWLAQSTYIEALRQWNLRSVLHHETIQEKLADALGNIEEISKNDIKAAIGIWNYERAQNATQNALLLLKSAFLKLEDAKEKLRPWLVIRFATKNFTQFDFPERHRIDDNDKPSPDIRSPQFRGTRNKTSFKEEPNYPGSMQVEYPHNIWARA